MSPDIPTVPEDGLPSSKMKNWFALLAPAGTPGKIVALRYHVLAPANSASFGFARQPNLHIERIEVALAALSETDVKLFRELAKAFQCYGKLAAIFRIFIRYHDGTPQVEATWIRYYDVDNPNGGAKRRCSLSTGPASTDV